MWLVKLVLIFTTILCIQHTFAYAPKYQFRTAVSRMWMNGIPKPNIITPSTGTTVHGIEKFLMMYTCKLCSGRNANMISKVAYTKGMVVATCRHCKSKHLIADNQRKLDVPELHNYGQRIEDLLNAKGETVQKLSISAADLEDNYLVDKDGILTIVPKMAGQPPVDSNVIDMSNAFGERNEPQ